MISHHKRKTKPVTIKPLGNYYAMLYGSMGMAEDSKPKTYEPPRAMQRKPRQTVYYEPMPERKATKRGRVESRHRGMRPVPVEHRSRMDWSTGKAAEPAPIYRVPIALQTIENHFSVPVRHAIAAFAFHFSMWTAVNISAAIMFAYGWRVLLAFEFAVVAYAIMRGSMAWVQRVAMADSLVKEDYEPDDKPEPKPETEPSIRRITDQTGRVMAEWETTDIEPGTIPVRIMKAAAHAILEQAANISRDGIYYALKGTPHQITQKEASHVANELKTDTRWTDEAGNLTKAGEVELRRYL